MNGAINILKKWQKICNEPRLCKECPLIKYCPCGRTWAESGIHQPSDWSDEDILQFVKTVVRNDNEKL